MTIRHEHPQLFQDAQPCPVEGCPATRLPGQHEPVPTCQHDLHHDTELRPKHCLNRHDPSTARLPDGF